MTKGDLERLQAALMITKIENVTLISDITFNGYYYYDIENQTDVYAIYDISDEMIEELQPLIKNIKLRRLERD